MRFVAIILLASLSLAVQAEIKAAAAPSAEGDAPRNEAGEKYISNGCSDTLKKLALWLAVTDGSLGNQKICAPKITTASTQNEKSFKVTITSESGKPVVFEFGNKDYHPCDANAQMQFRINGIEYVRAYNGSVIKLEDAKRVQEEMKNF